MKPHPMLTVRFVKRFLFLFIGGLILFFIFPGYAKIIWGIVFIGGILIVLILQASFPSTQVIVDEKQICFKREFRSWHPLRKYYLHQLIIPHSDWNRWIKIRLSDNEGSIQNFYLFFLCERLCFAAETKENGNLEYWIQKKFPDRPLETKHGFKKYRDRHDYLKEKDRMKVF